MVTVSLNQTYRLELFKKEPPRLFADAACRQLLFLLARSGTGFAQLSARSFLLVASTVYSYMFSVRFRAEVAERILGSVV